MRGDGLIVTDAMVVDSTLIAEVKSTYELPSAAVTPVYQYLKATRL